MSTQWFLRLATFMIAVVAVTSLAIGSSPALGAGITVNTTDDEVNADGDCSLREAIISANDDVVTDACVAGSGADVITLPAGTYVQSLLAGPDDQSYDDLDVLSDLTINGAGAASTIVDGGALDRVFEIDSNNGAVTVVFSGITIRNGGDGNGPDGGGIANRQALTLNNVVVTENNGDDGSGIDNDSNGTLTINDSTISNNDTDTSDDGGGIRNGGTLTVNRSTFNGNTADDSGGGGISNSGTATVNNSTFSGNSTIGSGGGISNTGDLTLNNSTIAGNSATGLNGGGGLSDANLLLSSTVEPADHFVSAGVGPGVVISQAAGIIPSGTITMTNTIVANNTTGEDCAVSSLTSNGHNLDSDGSCGLTGTGDQSSVDPQLAALAANGGPTQTQALGATSLAVDAGDAATCLATDQRGITRPQDGNNDASAVCDIGAFELEPAAPATGTPTPTLAPATATPAGLPQTGSSPDDGSSASTWFALGAAGVVAMLAAFWFARRRFGSSAA